MAQAWPAKPKLLDVVYCKFPQKLTAADGKLIPGPKARHCLVLELDETKTPVGVRVAFGTTKGIDRLYSGEFRITEADGDVYKRSGCTEATKFDLRRKTWLPFDDEWFEVTSKSVSTTPIIGKIEIGLSPDVKKRILAAANVVAEDEAAIEKPIAAPAK